MRKKIKYILLFFVIALGSSEIIYWYNQGEFTSANPNDTILDTFLMYFFFFLISYFIIYLFLIVLNFLLRKLNEKNSISSPPKTALIVLVLIPFIFSSLVYFARQDTNVDDAWGRKVIVINYLTGDYTPSAKIENVPKVHFSTAKGFMIERCHNINQSLIDSKKISSGTLNLYAFLSESNEYMYTRNKKLCITLISDKKLEIIKTDCGDYSKKLNDWNNLDEVF